MLTSTETPTRRQVLAPALDAQAREWLRWEYDTEYNLTPEQVFEAIEVDYPGGVSAFLMAG